MPASMKGLPLTEFDSTCESCITSCSRLKKHPKMDEKACLATILTWKWYKNGEK